MRCGGGGVRRKEAWTGERVARRVRDGSHNPQWAADSWELLVIC
jgi:hypothetical protein